MGGPSAPKGELESYADEESSRRPPKYLIFVTNVTLSAVQGSGAKDRMFKLADQVRMPLNQPMLEENGPEHRGYKAMQRAVKVKLRGFDVWDYDKLRVYLDQFEDIRRSFGAYISPGDVLAETVETMDGIRRFDPDFDNSMALFLQKELLADQFANLEQAGMGEQQVPVGKVFVDLPVFPERQGDPPEESASDLLPGFVSHVVDVSSRRLDSQSIEAESRGPGALGDSALPSDGRIVLLGGPGQGKSTIGQFLCQMFRAALLRSRPATSLSPEVTTALSVLESHFEEDGLSLPTTWRFPLRVVLSKFADTLANPGGPDSLLAYIADLITSRIPGSVSPSLMLAWLAEYPWLLVLDGLDEIPASSNREAVMKRSRTFGSRCFTSTPTACRLPRLAPKDTTTNSRPVTTATLGWLPSPRRGPCTMRIGS